MMRALVIGLVAMASAAQAQAPAPAAGSGAGGPVGPSVSQPTVPMGAVPPGTPSSQPARDAIGTAVIGKTETPASPVPGNTGGADSGVRR